MGVSTMTGKGEPLYVDAAVGSRDLVTPLTALGLPATLARLEFADLEFIGRGVKGEPVTIGIEVKRLTELTSDYDRFAGVQVPKMQAPTYDYRWLVYEGEWLTDKRTGALYRWAGRRRQPLHGQRDALALRKKLLTLEMCGGFHVHRTYDRVETVAFLHALYRFWTDEDLDRHKSHIVNYVPMGLTTRSGAEKAFGAWPGISTKRAKAVALRFAGSLRRACAASVDEWAAIEVPDDEGTIRRFGRKAAVKLDRFLDGDR